jgi:hypothetical protein
MAKPVGIAFSLTSAPGKTQQENGGWLINALVEKLGDGALNQVAWRRSPGLRELFTTASHTHCRGFIFVGSTLLVVYDTRVYSVTKSGVTYTVTNLGALAGTKPVTIARNNKSPTPDIVAVDIDNGAFNLFTGSAPTSFADADLPQPVAVTSQDGYLVFMIGDGRVFNTALNDVTVSALDFFTAEYRPDSGKRVVSNNNNLYVFGSESFEVWRNAGNATGSPFSRVTSRNIGIIGTAAISGWEPGFTASMGFVGADNVVYELKGYDPVRISEPDLERKIAALSETDRALVEVSCFMHSGHACLAVNSTSFSWVYDFSTGKWHQRKSYGAEYWRARQSIFAFGVWMVGDYATGKIFQVDETWYKEANDALIYDILSVQGAAFPNPLACHRVDFNFVNGTGISTGVDSTEIDPTIDISWSDDGGYNFAIPVQRKIGQQGKSQTVVGINGCGSTGQKGRQWRLRVSDPVYVSCMGGAAEYEKLAA